MRIKVLVLFMFIFVSCSVAGNKAGHTPPSHTALLEQTTIPSLTPSGMAAVTTTFPVQTPSQPTSTPSFKRSTDTVEFSTPTSPPRISITPAQAIEPGIPGPAQAEDTIPACLGEGVPEPPTKDFGFPGAIVYQVGDKEGIYSGIYSVGGKPLVYSRLPVQETGKYEVFGFSTIGEWLAYSLTEPFGIENANNNPVVYLLSYQGEHKAVKVDMSAYQAIISQGANVLDWRSPGSWINDELFYLSFLYRLPEVEGLRFFGGIFDPFGGIWRNDLMSKLANRNTKQDVGFSPDLTRALYTTDEAVVLLDLGSQKEVWKDPRGDMVWGRGPLFEWSSDSTRAAYMGLNTPIYLITRDGQMWKEVRGLIPSDPAFKVTPYDFRWSPDSHYLAVTMTKYDEGTNTAISMLFVYDAQKDEFVFRCPFNSYRNTPGVYWSPDGRYIIPQMPDLTIYPLVIFDLQTGSVVKLAENAIAVGWSDKFPTKWP